MVSPFFDGGVKMSGQHPLLPAPEVWGNKERNPSRKTINNIHILERFL
jgi:hypothetical protein